MTTGTLVAILALGAGVWYVAKQKQGTGNKAYDAGYAQGKADASVNKPISPMNYSAVLTEQADYEKGYADGYQAYSIGSGTSTTKTAGIAKYARVTMAAPYELSQAR